jgi:uncharacterized protein YjbI with pentapeptide repeats
MLGGLTELAIVAGMVILPQLPQPPWLPDVMGAIGSWLGIRWPALVGMVVVAAAVWRASRPAPPTTPPASAVVWESAPDGPGLVLRSPTTAAALASEARPRDWSKITSVVSAFTALAALVFTALSLNATRDQISISQQGEITGRYTAAVNQLGTPGSDHLGTRLGGIYALERLAKDSPPDQPTVMAVLSAFVRTNSPVPDAGQAVCTSVTLDVQAALTGLGRLDPNQDNGAFVDLSGSCLVGVDLIDAKLRMADLTGADLTRADLTRADLTGANLRRANLPFAQLWVTNLTGADLTEADLTNADLTHANLSGAFLRSANLTFAQLWATNLTDANLIEANLSGAFLTDAQLKGAMLNGANLKGVILNGTELKGGVLGLAGH